MKKLIIIFLLILLLITFFLAIQKKDQYWDVESYKICGKTYRDIWFTWDQKQIIEWDLIEIYWNSICDNIEIQDFDFALDNESYVLAWLLKDKKQTIILKDKKEISSYVNSEDISVAYQVYISRDGKYYIYSPYFQFEWGAITWENIQEYADIIKSKYPNIYGIFINWKQLYKDTVFVSLKDFMIENNIFDYFVSSVEDGGISEKYIKELMNENVKRS